jgi:hypothetical protein
VAAFPNPEELAYNRPRLPAQPLFRVRFAQKAVWSDYAGADADTMPTCTIWCCPERPPGTAAMTEAALAALVTRDSMIGLVRARTP